MKGSIDYKDFVKLQAQFERADMDIFCRKCSKELAARLLQKVKPRTPVGNYDNLMPGYERDTAGTLRRNWTGGKDMDPYTYAQSLPVKKQGVDYVITVKNPTEYASYVENGHRQTPGRYVPAIGKRLKAGWVEGQHFLKISEDEIKTLSPALLEKRLEQKLREVLRD